MADAPRITNTAEVANKNVEASPELTVKRGVTLKSQAVGVAELVPGTVLGKITATGKYAPYDDTHNDGTEVADCILLNFMPSDGNDKVLEVATGGVLYLDQLVGLDAAAVSDLGAVELPNFNQFKF